MWGNVGNCIAKYPMFSIYSIYILQWLVLLLHYNSQKTYLPFDYALFHLLSALEIHPSDPCWGWVAFLCLDVPSLKPLLLCAVQFEGPLAQMNQRLIRLSHRQWPGAPGEWRLTPMRISVRWLWSTIAIRGKMPLYGGCSPVWQVVPGPQGQMLLGSLSVCLPSRQGALQLLGLTNKAIFPSLSVFTAGSNLGLRARATSPLLPTHPRAALLQLSGTGVGGLWCNDN